MSSSKRSEAKGDEGKRERPDQKKDGSKSKSRIQHSRPHDGGTFSHFRKNLEFLDEAREKRQFELGVNDVENSDIDSHHHSVVADGASVTARLLGTSWGDGTDASHREVLHLQDVDLVTEPLIFAGADGDAASQALINGAGDSTADDRKRRGAERRAQHRLFAETASGSFKKWRPGAPRRRTASGSGARSAGDGQGGGILQDNGWYARYARRVKALRPTERGLWLLAQGLLAGLTAGPVMLQVSANDDAQFVVSYQRIATLSRRAMYCLSFVAVLGALDTLHQALYPQNIDVADPTVVAQQRKQRQAHGGSAPPLNLFGSAGHGAGGGRGAVAADRPWKERSWEERLHLVLVALLYLAVFTGTLVCSVGDVVIDNKDGYEEALLRAQKQIGPEVVGESWEEYALEGSDADRFKPILETWYGFNVVRMVCAVSAWVLVARLLFLATVASHSEEDLAVASRLLHAEQERTRKLSGHTRTLESMHPLDLRRLLREQKRATEATASVLGLLGAPTPPVTTTTAFARFDEASTKRFAAGGGGAGSSSLLPAVQNPETQSARPGSRGVGV